mgnify:CR=1 FL=1
MPLCLEECALMAWQDLLVSNNTVQPMQQELLDKHYLRKHGKTLITVRRPENKTPSPAGRQRIRRAE